MSQGTWQASCQTGTNSKAGSSQGRHISGAASHIPGIVELGAVSQGKRASGVGVGVEQVLAVNSQRGATTHADLGLVEVGVVHVGVQDVEGTLAAVELEINTTLAGVVHQLCAVPGVDLGHALGVDPVLLLVLNDNFGVVRPDLEVGGVAGRRVGGPVPEGGCVGAHQLVGLSIDGVEQLPASTCQAPASNNTQVAESITRSVSV